MGIGACNPSDCERSTVSDQVIDIFSAAGLKNRIFLSCLKNSSRKCGIFPLKECSGGASMKTPQRWDPHEAEEPTRPVPFFRKDAWWDDPIAYKNRAIETVEVIEELIKPQRNCGKQTNVGRILWLSWAELAFYEALEVNDSVRF